MSKENNYNMVREFHTKFAVDPIPFVKSFPLRVELIREESAELEAAVLARDEVGIVDALTDLLYVIYGSFISFDLNVEWIDEDPTITENFDIERLAGLVDSYVEDLYAKSNADEILTVMSDMGRYIYTVGTGLGNDLDGAFAEVHRSNMSKLDDDGKPVKRTDGKILKGPNYTPPNLSPFIPDVD